MKKFLKGPFIYLILILAIILVAQAIVKNNNQDSSVISYTDFLKKLSDGEITRINIQGYEAVALAKDTKIKPDTFPGRYDYYTYLPSYYQIDVDFKAALKVDDLSKSSVIITYQRIENTSIWLGE